MMDFKVMMVLLVVNIVYLLFGGLIFQILEEEEEDDTRVSARTAISSFLDNHSCVNPEDLEQFIRAVIHAYDGGILAIDNATNPSHWDFGSSVFFSGTVVTTIGYGHISPSTNRGRVFCVFYAIFGIPLMLVLLAGIGEKMHQRAEWFDRRLKLSFCAENPKLGKALRTVVILALGILLFIFIPSGIFTAVEDWTYRESLYYGVVTLTTIGFGDFVPGEGAEDKHYKGLYCFCIWCWIFFGLAWLATVLAGLQEIVKDLTSKVAQKAGKQKKGEDSGGENNNAAAGNQSRKDEEGRPEEKRVDASGGRNTTGDFQTGIDKVSQQDEGRVTGAEKPVDGV